MDRTHAKNHHETCVIRIVILFASFIHSFGTIILILRHIREGTVRYGAQHPRTPLLTCGPSGTNTLQT
eukprot:scaffold31036_cov42-Attheya_sp.AAC.3